ncbi:MAG: DoxX family protein [Chitinophagales bacterium]|nr:DoxX family protein [Chitinophagales bacterium]
MSFLNKEFKTGKDLGLLILRIAAGLSLVYGHGWGKMMTIISGDEIQFLDPIGLGVSTSFYMAAFAEGICASLLIIGLFARPAAAILIINFSVISYLHGIELQDGFSVLELVFLYYAMFISLFLLGPGKFSLDYKIFGK